MRRRGVIAIGSAAAWACLCLGGAALASAGPPSSIRFTDVSKTCGIDFVMTCGATPSREIVEVNGGGVALFDFDKDGDLDVFLANGATMDRPSQGPGCRLYANRGDGTFEDVTKATGLTFNRWAMGVAVGDYDGDGWDDVYIACYGKNALLRNTASRESGRRWVDVTDVAGVGDGRWATSAAFGDLDQDGDLDLYVVNYLAFDCRNPPPRSKTTFKGATVMSGPAGLTPQADVLYENLGDGRFRDVSKPSGCQDARPEYGLGVRIVDLDSDGRQDIVVGNDSTENFLFHGLGGMRFEEIGVIAGVASSGEGGTQATMGIAIGDIDGNGRPDLFSTNFSSDTNTLHMNLGDGFFDDRTSRYGLAAISRPFLSWGCAFVDFDGDGDEDLFIASGHVYPEAATHKIDSDYKQPPLLFERRGTRFHRVLDAGPMFRRAYAGRATAFGDLDGDGDMDIVMTTLNGPVLVFRNDARGNDLVVVQLEDAGQNPRAYGSMIELVAGETVQRRWITGGGSYQSADAAHAYFGLGDQRPVAGLTLRITWPDGETSESKNVPPNKLLTVRRDSTGVRVVAGALGGRPQATSRPRSGHGG